jgi:hypothetical protein
MENKQTAVEWLIDKVEDHFCLLPIDLIEQAKQMEKEQIIDAWEEGCYQSSRFPRMSDVEQYYNETYGSQAPQRLEEANEE